MTTPTAAPRQVIHADLLDVAAARSAVFAGYVDSHPSARTRSSTFRVEVPVMYAVMITTHNAWSTRRRGSNKLGKNDPTRSFRIATRCRQPASTVCGSGRRFADWSECRCVRGARRRRRRQRGIDQLLHPALPQRTEQVLGVAVAQVRDQVVQAGPIMVGHRVLSFSVSACAASPRLTRWPTQPVDPLRYFHHLTGRQPKPGAGAKTGAGPRRARPAQPSCRRWQGSLVYL